MRHLLALLLLLGGTMPTWAGQNPRVEIYLYTTSTGVGGTNHMASPLPGAPDAEVYVCFDNVWGAILGASWRFVEQAGPQYDLVTNLYGGVGGLTIGDPGSGEGCSMTTGDSPAYPDANGIVVLACVRYSTPEGRDVGGGTITIVPHLFDDRVVWDASSDSDYWCVRSVGWNGLSGNFAWDDSPVVDGDCWTPVEAAGWGAVKALFR